MLRAQNTIEYALLIATVAVLTLLGGSIFGATLAQWLANVFARLPPTTY